MEKRTMKSFYNSTTLILAVGLFLMVNLVGTLFFTGKKIDLTENNLFTLSSEAKKLASQIDEPIMLRFFYSEELGKQLPGFELYANRVQELLNAFETASQGKLKVQIIHPEPFSEEEDSAVAFGLKGIPVDDSGEQVYFGIVGTNSIDQRQTMAFLQPERENFLEYDLAKMVYDLDHPKKPKVAILSSLPLQGIQPNPQLGQRGSQPWLIIDQISQFFDVTFYDPTKTKIADDIDLLMVVHPKDFDENTLFEIDQFVLKGGNTIIFVDPHSEIDAATSAQGGFGIPFGPTNSGLEKLFDQWGVELVSQKVVGDLKAAQKVSFGGQGGQPKSASYVAWLGLDKKNLDEAHPITGNLSNIKMASAGAFKVKDKDAKTSIEPLIFSSKESMLIDADKVKVNPDPIELLNGFKKSDKEQVIAGLVKGKFKTAFPNGVKQEEKAENSESKQPNKETKNEQDTQTSKPVIKESQKPASLILVADVDFLNEVFWAQVQDFFGQKVLYPTASNANFVINALDNLSGNETLSNLRSRGQSARPFTKVQEIKIEAEKKYRIREKQLQEKLVETENKLVSLQKGDNQSDTKILNPEQKKAIENFRLEMVQTRKELRAVQHELRKDIEVLGSRVKFINIFGIPMLIGLVALALSYARRQKRRRPKIQTN